MIGEFLDYLASYMGDGHTSGIHSFFFYHFVSYPMFPKIITSKKNWLRVFECEARRLRVTGLSKAYLHRNYVSR